MLHIDGSRESGSGTIFRTALSLAAVLGQAVEISNIRQQRDPPGLRPQHVMAARAIHAMTGGNLVSAELNSQWVAFEPEHPPRGGTYDWILETAGSTTLIAWALIAPASMADRSSAFQLTGGTFQDFAPTAFHFQYCLLPLLARMGLKTESEIIRPGYVPKGRGLLHLKVNPVNHLEPLTLLDTSEDFELWGITISSHLDRQKVSDRMAESAEESLARHGLQSDFRRVYDHTAHQPGAAMLLVAENASCCTLGSDMAGAPGRRSERIGKNVVKSLLHELKAGATVDWHLADQLILFASLARGTSSFRFSSMTDHIKSAIWLAREMVGAEISVQGNRIEIQGVGFTNRWTGNQKSDP